MDSVYEKISNETAEVVIDMAQKQDSWTFFKKSGNVEISYQKSNYFNGNAFKFKALVAAPASIVWDLLKPGLISGVKSWDKSIADYSVVQKISENKLIARILTFPALFGAVASREMITFFASKEDTQVCIDPDYGKVNWIFARSVEHEKYPIVTSPVRAINHPTGYLVAECKSDPSKCYVELYVNTDIGGMLPQRLVEAALPGQQVTYIKSVTDEAIKRLAQSLTANSTTQL